MGVLPPLVELRKSVSLNKLEFVQLSKLQVLSSYVNFQRLIDSVFSPMWYHTPDASQLFFSQQKSSSRVSESLEWLLNITTYSLKITTPVFVPPSSARWTKISLIEVQTEGAWRICLLHLCVYLWSLFKLGLRCQHSARGCQSLYRGHTPH